VRQTAVERREKPRKKAFFPMRGATKMTPTNFSFEKLAQEQLRLLRI
jgi:hypothetical protein